MYIGDFFLPGITKESEKSNKITEIIYNECKDVFTGINYFEVTFMLQVNNGGESYQAPLRHIGYELQHPFKEE